MLRKVFINLRENKDLAIFALVYSFLFLLAVECGKVVYEQGCLPDFVSLKQNGRVFYLWPLLFLLLSVLTYILLLLLKNRSVKEVSFLPKFCHNPYVPALLILLSFMLVYMVYYPGTWCYDILFQNKMIMGIDPFTKHHPPLHTFIWGACRSIENATQGGLRAIAVYSVTQIVLTSLVYGRVVHSVWKETQNDILSLIAFLFFACNPTFQLFSFSPIKDAWFTMCFLLVCVYVYEGSKEGFTRKRIVLISIFTFLSCLFRNNMIYALIPFGIIVFILWKKRRKTILIAGAAILLAFILVDKILYGILGIKETERKEMLSVPIQQIGCVYRDQNGSLTEEELNGINRFIPLESLSKYNSHIADPVKKDVNDEVLEQDFTGFIKLWLRLGAKYPKSYIKAYLVQYSPYWYPFSESYDSFSITPYIEDYAILDENYPFIRADRFSRAYDIYRKLAKGTSLPVFSRGIILWLCLTMFAFALALRKNKKSVLIPLLSLCYFATLFLGPLCIARYTYHVLAAFPLMTAMLLNVSFKRESADQPKS